jgi:hypothetical protein
VSVLPRALSARIARAVFSRNELSVAWSAVSCATSRRLELMAGLKYFVDALAFSPLPSYQRALPEVNSCSPRRVLGSSVLRSWSMSTIGCVWSVR